MPKCLQALFLALLLIVTACAGESKSNGVITGPEARTIELAPTDTLLSAFGDTLVLRALSVDGSGTKTPVSTAVWSTSDAGVVAVSTAGVVTARSQGTAIVTGRVGTLSAAIGLRVEQRVTSVVVADVVPSVIKAIGVRIALVASPRDRNGNTVLTQRISWSITDSTIASVDTTGLLRTLGPGRATVLASVGAVTTQIPIEVATRIRIPIDSFLATPIAGAVWDVPTVIVSYIPTADGVNLDVSKSPDFRVLNPLSLSTMERNILDIVRRKKMVVEHGSRFRGYRNSAARPSLGIRVVEHINVYEVLPPSSRPGLVANTRLPDWHRVFAQLGLDTLIRNRGVKQVWAVTGSFDATYPSYDPAIHNLADTRYLFESNMSSPTTGDISNSDRNASDLPVLGHTYIVYGINFRRSQAEAIHNVGHQLEAQFAHVNQTTEGNTDLFWRSFVGRDAAGAFVAGRSGWTHMPPNTTTNYDYLNTTAVQSDIEDWRPDGSGTRKAVNVNTWGQLTYPWPGAAEFGQRVEAQWYAFWMQNMPGLDNGIPRGAGVMTNWWAFVGDWDAAIRARTGLSGARP
jgi:Bacterial Ig-like domain (group 2)